MNWSKFHFNEIWSVKYELKVNLWISVYEWNSNWVNHSCSMMQENLWLMNEVEKGKIEKLSSLKF